MRRAVTASVVLMAGMLAVFPTSVATADSSFSASRELVREHLIHDATSEDPSSATATQVDRRTFSLNVSRTTNLRARQEIHVSWSGAIPTGGLAADPNSAAGALQEHPVVLLQCRGVDTTGAVPKGQSLLTPESCWTQTPAERFLYDTSSAPAAWRLDRWASADERQAKVGRPDSVPDACGTVRQERWLPFVASDGTTYAGGRAGCAGTSPDSDTGDGDVPSNTIYGVTGADGTGSADFSVSTADTNASLGCSNAVNCSLVVVPIEGISCDGWSTQLPADQRPTKQVAEADAECRSNGNYTPGSGASTGITPSRAVDGELWWSASNWRNRISVPLKFAASQSWCAVVSKKEPFAINGSELFAETADQWSPTFCSSKTLHPFAYGAAPDSLARSNLAMGAIKAAVASRPPDTSYPRPTVQAPLALTGFAIGFTVDDQNGNRLTDLRLNARLIAKLLTQSYTTNSIVASGHPDIGTNPLNLTEDPEFLALNPSVEKQAVKESASTLQLTSSDADAIWALTSYIQADPEARAWLDGTPDPWGMVVNPAYKSIALPVSSWDLKDTWVASSYASSGLNACYSYSPSSYLNNVHFQLGSMATVVQDVQYGASASLLRCDYDPGLPSSIPLKKQGRQRPGSRFVLGLVPLTSIARYNLRAASLQTTSTVPAGTTFSDASGRTFVGADSAGLKAASALFTPDKTAGTWRFDYSAVGTSRGAAAYPGAMLVSAHVPTSGLGSDDAKHIASFLTYGATKGQRPGDGSGELSAGDLPLTKANGLGQLSIYTQVAALAVAAQSGKVPALDAKLPKATTSATKPTGKPTSSAKRPASVATPVAPRPTVAPTTSAASPAASTDVAASTLTTTATQGTYTKTGYLAAPTLLLVGVTALVAGAALQWGAHVAAAVRALIPRRRKRRR